MPLLDVACLAFESDMEVNEGDVDERGDAPEGWRACDPGAETVGLAVGAGSFDVFKEEKNGDIELSCLLTDASAL